MIKNHAEEVSINIYYHVIVGYGKKLLNFIPKEIKRDVKSSAIGNI